MKNHLLCRTEALQRVYIWQAGAIQLMLTQVNGKHDTTHTVDKQTLTISFNQNVTYSSSQGNLVSGDGTNTLVIDYGYHNNPTDNIGLGDLVVEAGDGLEITSVSITDDPADWY